MCSVWLELARPPDRWLTWWTVLTSRSFWTRYRRLETVYGTRHRIPALPGLHQAAGAVGRGWLLTVATLPQMRPILCWIPVLIQVRNHGAPCHSCRFALLTFLPHTCFLVNNYMNEAPAHCYQKFGYFTPGQVTRMLQQWEAWRTQPPASCKRRKMNCLKRDECCKTDTIQCVRLTRGSRVGRCMRCKKYTQICVVNSQCCSGKCKSGSCTKPTTNTTTI